LHVVDLDGARQGHPVQLDLVRRIAQEAPLELGGGLRSEADVERGIEAGVQRVVVGTAALDLELTTELALRFGERLVVALDTRSGTVAVKGWTEESDRALLELAEALIDVG